MSTRTRSVLSVAAITGAIGLSAIGVHSAFAQNNPGNAQQPAMQMNTNGTNGNGANNTLNAPPTTTNGITTNPNGDVPVPNNDVAPSNSAAPSTNNANAAVNPTGNPSNGGGFNNTAYNGSPVVTETAPIAGGTGSGYAYTPGWGAHVTLALIDLRQARGYLNFPNKFDMMDDDWSAVHHVSDAIKDAEANNIYDGHAVYFTPAESVTLSDTDRLWKAKEMVKKAQDEIGQVDTSGNSNLGNLSADLSATSDSLDKAMAADDWRQSLTNDTQFLPTGSRDY
jgi:hypothetical protein